VSFYTPRAGRRKNQFGDGIRLAAGQARCVNLRKPDDHNHKQSRFRSSPRLCRVDCNIFRPPEERTGRIDERTFLPCRSAYAISLKFLNFVSEFGPPKRLLRRPATLLCSIVLTFSRPAWGGSLHPLGWSGDCGSGNFLSHGGSTGDFGCPDHHRSIGLARLQQSLDDADIGKTVTLSLS
jgi:hypothetical protein